MTPEEFRAHAHQVADWIADYRRDIERYPVVPALTPGAIRAQLPARAPERGESFDAMLADLERVILPGMTHWQHPGWFAYFPSNACLPSVLAEMLAAGLAAQCMSWITSPAATELEQVTLDWLRRLLGLPDGFTGVIQDTASTATLSALLVARDEAWRRAGREAHLALYSSEEAHSSVWKAGRLAGFRDDALRPIPTDETFALKPEVLAAALEEDVSRGRIPAAIVATVGTTSSGALDPVRAVGELARRHGAFLHVDAAWAGAAALVPELRSLFDGIELADSLVLNPHKWLGVSFDCSTWYVRDLEALQRTFAATPEYLRTAADPAVVNYRDWGIPLGRRFRALKLWFVLRSEGAQGLRRMIREHVRLARLFAEWVDGEAGFERLAPVPLALVSFRRRPEGMGDGSDLDHLNRRLLERVNASGRVFLTHTTLRGRYALRLAVGQSSTTMTHLQEAWELIRRAAGEDD